LSSRIRQNVAPELNHAGKRNYNSSRIRQNVATTPNASLPRNTTF